MSKHFSANQYEGAFKSGHLQNWQVPKSKIEQRPNKYEGYTVVISDDKGYLLSHATRSKESPWGSFVGTWDMPTKIPGNSALNATARHPSSAKSLKDMRKEFEQKLKKNLPIAEAPSRQSSARQNEDENRSNSTNNAAVLTETVPGSKPQTPKTPLNDPKGYESPSLNKVTIPTPLGLQDTDIAMKSVRTPSRESTPRKTISKQEGDFKESEQVPPISEVEAQVEMVPSNKPSTPKTPLQDMGRTEEIGQSPVPSPAPLSEKGVVSCSPCPSQRGVGFARAPAAAINWPGPKSLSHRTVD